MRVVAGSVKGHTLRFPKGSHTRPTSEKVREAIFAMVTGCFEQGLVLDLFAGSGALGIEALSRGAERAVFVERHAASCRVIRENLTRTRLAESATIMCMSVERAVRMLDDRFALILLDPPYALPNLDDIMMTVGGAGILQDSTIVVFEHSPRFAVEERYVRLALERHKVYGDTAVSIFVVREDIAA